MQRQRTIQSAIFEAPRGEVTIDALMAMEPAAWEHLRGEINLRRGNAPDRPLARCLICKSPVYIKAQATAAGNVPLFAHYADAEPDCPWYQGKPLVPDDARAAQYRGQQECARHRWMCETIADIFRADPRTLKVTVDQYLKPAIEERGRYPDVFADLGDTGKFAVEVQLSKPFAFEVAARHLHYRSEGVSLIWVFSDLADELPQGFRDVVRFQRGNAFLFDAVAHAASLERGELVCPAIWKATAAGSNPGWSHSPISIAAMVVRCFLMIAARRSFSTTALPAAPNGSKSLRPEHRSISRMR